MMSMRFVLVLLPLLTQLALAQPPAADWSHTYGGEATELLNDVQPTNDGGFIFAGLSGSFGFGDDDAYVLRTDANGDSLWSNTYGGFDNDVAGSIRPTSDGGWIIAGSTASSGAGHTDMWLLKLAANGSQQWQHTYGGAGYDFATAGEQTSDGGYILCGATTVSQFAYPQARLIKTDSAGTVVWERTYGADDHEQAAMDVHQTSDHGYILCGYNSDFNLGHGGWDAWVLKTDSAGNNPQQQFYGGVGSDAAYSIQQTTDGGYILAGFTDRDASIAEDYYFVKTDANLDTAWTRNWGRVFLDEAFDVIQTSDGGYLATGHTCIPFFGDCRYDILLVKTDSNGDSLWTWQFGNEQNDGANATRQTSDGGYIVAGYNTSPDVLDYDALAVHLEGGCADFTPRAPEGMTAHSFGNDIRLRWHPVTQSLADCPVVIDYYTVFTDADADGNFETVVGSTADSSFTDVGAVSNNAKNFYRVVATGQ
jgi:hypothetical protein